MSNLLDEQPSSSLLVRFKIIIALAIVLMLSSQTIAARAQVGDVDPILMDPGLIVVSSDTSFEDPALITLFADRPSEVAIAEYISTAFEKEGLDIQVIDRGHYKGTPAGLQPERVLFANIRIDLASINNGPSRSFVVGSVSTMFRRAESSLLSPSTITFFGGEATDAELSHRASTAVFDQVAKSLVSPLLQIKH